ncbi:hypothetical protein Pmani_012062 [Petrolisthes manimaculis]|uniref:C2 domain-containing protein n=1 Tax=Petrolisthes manimaculis TaxID=1843537 RepID=A0AAE1UF11_9EUCA|nr:hypothetical protein Pmani_012062 [Petrolisthes manimaculis]
MGVFWAWVEGATGNIAVALQSVVEQVRSWVSGVGLKGLGLPSSMDTLNTLLVGWMLFVTLILILGSFFYFKFIHQLDNESDSVSEDVGPKRDPRDKEKAGSNKSTQESKAGKSKPVGEPARTPTIVPRQPPSPVSPPVGTGADPDAVSWANNVFTWLYNSHEGGKVIKKIWLDTVNENTVKTAIDTGILVEVVELLPATPAPVLSNMVVDCSPTDNVTITCDCDATVYLRLVTTRTQGESTTESEYACAIHPLRGRLNLAALTADLSAVVKFDGWPENVEVSLSLEGIRNNAKGLDEQQMLDVITEVLTSALRNSVLDIDFKPVLTFPKFRRSRQEPDRIIPVGYDSMVRELQTHPPSAKSRPRPAHAHAYAPASTPAPAPAPAPLIDEMLEEAGESFTSLTFTSSPGLASGLTTSEEHLIARNLNKYPSLENTDLEPEEIADLCKTWQENYVPTTDIPINITAEEEKNETAGKEFVLVASNRSKLIDEPRRIVPVEVNQELEDELEEEPELTFVIGGKPHDEPCIRRQTGSPLLLAAPKVTNDTTVVAEEEEEEEGLEDNPMTLDQMAKSLGVLDGGSSGLGSHQKEFPVSDAWCAGVDVRTLQLDSRAVGGVACDLECTQKDLLPTPPSLPPVHSEKEPSPPSSSPAPPFPPSTSLLDTSACGLPVGNIDEQSDQSSSYLGDEGKNLGSSGSALMTRSSDPNQDETQQGVRDWKHLDCTVEGRRTKNIQCSQVTTEVDVICTEQTIGGFSDSELEESCLDQIEGSQRISICSASDGGDQEDLPCHPDLFDTSSSGHAKHSKLEEDYKGNVDKLSDSQEENESHLKYSFEDRAIDVSLSQKKAHKAYDPGSDEDTLFVTNRYEVKCENEPLPESILKTCIDVPSNSDCKINVEFRKESGSGLNIDESSTSHQSDESGLRKLCLNVFTESLFSRIELEDSVISLPEEFTEDAAWEATEVYEAEDRQPPVLDATIPSALDHSDDDTQISDSILGKPEDGSVSSSDKPNTTSSSSQFTSSFSSSSDNKETYPDHATSKGPVESSTDFNTSKKNLENHITQQIKSADNSVSGQFELSVLKEKEKMPKQNKEIDMKVSEDRLMKPPTSTINRFGDISGDSHSVLEDEGKFLDDILSDTKRKVKVEATTNIEMKEPEKTASNQCQNVKTMELDPFSLEVQSGLRTEYPEMFREKSQECDLYMNISDLDEKTDSPYTDSYIASMRDPFSPDEEDFGCPSACGHQSDHTEFEILDSSATDSEVEEITGKGEKGHDSLVPQSRSHIVKQWRKSDIIQIPEAEVVDSSSSAPNDVVQGLAIKDTNEGKPQSMISLSSSHNESSDNIKVISGEQQKISLSFSQNENSGNMCPELPTAPQNVNVTSPEQIKMTTQDISSISSQMDVQRYPQDNIISYKSSLNDMHCTTIPSLMHVLIKDNTPESSHETDTQAHVHPEGLKEKHVAQQGELSRPDMKDSLSASGLDSTSGIARNNVGSAEGLLRLTSEPSSCVATLTRVDAPDTLTDPYDTIQTEIHPVPLGAPDILTHPYDTTHTQTPQQSLQATTQTSHSPMAMQTMGDATTNNHHHHNHHPPTTTTTTTTGRPLWTRPLQSYPVYGTYYVTSSMPSSTSGQQVGIPGLNGKRLLVKIVKATGVGCEKSVSDAYAVVEMDEPPQKFTTSVAKDTNSPFWDEQFLFDLSGGTLELLFELYDRSDGNFLGLGIVGIEELVATPSQRQIIPLQSRPYENDNVSGSLTVEFLFLDRAEVPEHTVRTSATSQSVGPKGALVTTTTTTYVKAPEGVDDDDEETTNVSPCPEDANVNPDIIVNGGDGVAAAALRDIEEKKVVVANNASKSTMIIHASRKEVTKRVKQVQRAPSGEYTELSEKLEEELALDVSAGIGTTSPTTSPHTSPHHSAPTTTTAPGSPPTENTTESNDTEERGRSRGVRRKRDSFFGTLKKRFSRSKIRSKSMEPGREPSAERDQSVGRSVSMERSTNISRQSDEQPPKTPSSQEQTEPRLLSVPPGVGGGGGDGGSTRSSLSDASAISGSSTRTYINEASMLIIETTENGVYKHYLIPLSLQQKSKWRKKGTKLHIYGEHTFVAKHMSSSTQCEVCGKTMGRRLGKQGYACRDCGYRCHKPCHVKTETTCPSSKVNSMDLVIVKDVREERRAWHKKNKTT